MPFDKEVFFSVLCALVVSLGAFSVFLCFAIHYVMKGLENMLKGVGLYLDNIHTNVSHIKNTLDEESLKK